MNDLRVPRRTNPDLQRERQTASFSVPELSVLIHGGVERARTRKRVLDTLFSDPHFQQTEERYLLSYEERYTASLSNVQALMRVRAEHGWSMDEYEIAANALQFEVGIVVHFVMFVPALEQLASPEQLDRWLPAAHSLKIMGTYGQTEIGHGTNLRCLQTRADYDASTGEFIINTPLPEGMKWWPGGLGKSCNYVLLLAQLYVGDKNHGMQAFMVQIRDLDTHCSLPGVEVGDIGPRISGIPSDNGFLILRDVRVPLENMLARNVEMKRDGTFLIKSSPSKANYSTMVLVRAVIVNWAFMVCSKSATVATRYSAVRRQCELDPSEPEVQILDFQTQQYKLFPNIALAYACLFASKYIFSSYNRIHQEEIQKGDYSSLPELHSQSSGLKAYTTDLTTEAAEVLRRACGGHGFLMSSGIGPLSVDAVSSVTVEGENTVLYQQVARFLLKCFVGAMSGEMQGHFTKYFLWQPPPCSVNCEQDLGDLSALTHVFQHRAYWKVSCVTKSMQTALAAGQPQHQAWNDNCVQLVQAAKAHMEYVVVSNFVDSVAQLDTSPNICHVLSLLCQLHALHRIVVSSGDFLQSGALTVDQLKIIQKGELKLLLLIRPEAVSLVDAFDYHDQILMSSIGSYDGNVYERLYLMAKKSPLNKTDVHPAFHKYIKPLQQQSAKL